MFTADKRALLQEARVEREAMIKEAREIKRENGFWCKNWPQAEAIRWSAGPKFAIESEKESSSSR